MQWWEPMTLIALASIIAYAIARRMHKFFDDHPFG